MERFNKEIIEIADVRHARMCGGTDVICGHPRQGGIMNFGGGELGVIHFHAPCTYQTEGEGKHDFGGYHSRSVVLLQRSFDGGETWPTDKNVIIYDESKPIEERARFLMRNAPMATMNMASPGTAFYFGRSYAGEMDPLTGEPKLICFSLRSDTKGASWESVPSIVQPQKSWDYCHKDNHPVVRMDDGTYLGAMTFEATRYNRSGVALFGSDDEGVTWRYLSEIAVDETGMGRPTYAGLLLLPDGTLQCYMLQIGGAFNAICVSSSKDGGYSWSARTPIVHWGHSPWRSHLSQSAFGSQNSGRGCFYRSPWAMLLRDGRILVLFARRIPPYGIGGIISADMGQTWSDEFVVRDDGAGPDMGYPVATQLDDGRIFTAYYFTERADTPVGWIRTIQNTTFRIV